MPGDENDRRRLPACQLPLEFETVDVGKLQIQDQQEGASGFSNSKIPRAEPNAATRNPTEEIRLHSASRTRASSSTKKIMGLSGVTTRHSHTWKSEAEGGARSVDGCGPQAAVMGFDDGTADR